MNPPQSGSAGEAAVYRRTIHTKDIVEAAIAAGNFTFFVAAVNSTGLANALSANGPFTVFAPTDAAFRKLPDGTWNKLIQDSGKLTAILNYHLVSGYLIAGDMKSGEMMTLQGSTVTVEAVSPTDVTLNGAHITKSDLTAINGVIHSIDAVILPKSWRLPAA